ncbi:MAG: hypothetical protein NT062_17465 [Proteobacteria bacterium]|nr:hypothetical protein [Pseudomonadota bacterium]
MRIFVLVIAGVIGGGLATSGCESCPDGASGGSLYCHAETCRAEETTCAGICADLQNDRDNCGACGTSCGDGMSCSQGQCSESCAGTETRCNGTCTDTTSDPTNCGTCGTTCSASQTCNNGTCGCPTGDLVCGGLCTDPATDEQHCGATSDCLGNNAGTICSANQACSGGACVSTLFYRGSLPASTGRWTYGGVLGLDGANADCNLHFAGSQVCSADKLALAQAKNELINATDYNNVAVTDWWIDDPTATPDARCNFVSQENLPWTYQTAHLGHYSKFVSLTPATGVITPVQTGNIAASTGLCSQTRFVACCSIATAP